MFGGSSLPVRIMGNLILLAIAVMMVTQIVTGAFFEYDKSDFIKFTQPPQILDPATLQESHVFAPGDGFIIKYHIRKHEIGCFAEYQNTLVGPVSYQLPPRRTQFIGRRGTVSDNVARAYAEVPKHLPKGVYQVQLAVFPICDGVPRDAFRLANPTPTIRVE